MVLAAVPLLVVLTSQSPTRPFSLMVGDPAPPVQVAEFLKGEPISQFRQDHVYVVEFWATWCGPCKESIPHLTELQKKYLGKATFLGVSVWEPRVADVAPFVKEWNAKMDYTVARDSVGDLAAANDAERSRESVQKGFMSKRWLVDSGWDQNGIPVAFLVDRSGKIAWIGDPMKVDEPLAKVVDGKFDLADATRVYRSEMEIELFARTERRLAQEARKAGRFEDALRRVEAILAKSAKFEDDAIFKFEILLVAMKQPDRAAQYALDVLPRVAWNIPMNMAAPMAHDGKDLTAISARTMIDVCLKVLEKLGREHTWPLMTAAELAHRLGDPKQAVEFADRALKIAKENDRKSMLADRDRYAKGGGRLANPG